MEDRVERDIELASSKQEVWRALTSPTELSAWFGAEAEIEAPPGGRATFHWPDGTLRRAAIEVLEPEERMLLRWLPFEQDRDGRIHQRDPGSIEFVLEAAPSGTRLRVIESRQRRLPSLTEPTSGNQVSGVRGAEMAAAGRER